MALPTSHTRPGIATRLDHWRAFATNRGEEISSLLQTLMLATAWAAMPCLARQNRACGLVLDTNMDGGKRTSATRDALRHDMARLWRLSNTVQSMNRSGRR